MMTDSCSDAGRDGRGPVKYEEKIGSEPDAELTKRIWKNGCPGRENPDEMSQSEQREACQAMWREYCPRYDDTGIGAVNTKEKG